MLPLMEITSFMLETEKSLFLLQEQAGKPQGIRQSAPHCGSLWASGPLPETERNEYAVARWPCGECWSPYFTPEPLETPLLVGP